jgi:hypothetical protein
MFVGYQFMLFGTKQGEIIAEVQVPADQVGLLNLPPEPPHSIAVDAAIAQHIVAAVGWTLTEQPDEWYVECQRLYRR